MSLSRGVVFGFDDASFDQGDRRPVAWCEEFATNGHMLVAGKSGTGKTFTLRRIVTQLARPIEGREPVRVHVFDVHGDIQFEGESRVLFSESTAYGINPLRLSSDPHYGGVRKCVQSFIEMLEDSQVKLGVRQVATLRNLLYELFEMRGFRLDDPATWEASDDEEQAQADEKGRIFLEVPYDERDAAKAAARSDGVTLAFCAEKRGWWCSHWSESLQRWPLRCEGRRPPTVMDLTRHIGMRIKSMVTGGNSKCMRMLEDHNKRVQSWHKRTVQAVGRAEGASGEELEAIRDEITVSAQALLETFTDYVTNIATGHELDALVRYESLETLKSLKDRLDTLASSGIFRSRRPNFDGHASIWSYDLSPLRDAEQKFFVWTCLSQIFEQAKERGIVRGGSEVNTVIVLDEAHKFFAEKDGNIIDTLAKEARKFGVALICASQAPSHFSEDFLGNVGTKVLLGLDPMYRDQTIRKMRIEPAILDYVVAGKIAAVQVSDKRDQTHRFTNRPLKKC